MAAQNRTPTVAAAWLHRHHGYDAEEALAVAAARINRPQGFLADAVRRLAAVPYDPAGGGG